MRWSSRLPGGRIELRRWMVADASSGAKHPTVACHHLPIAPASKMDVVATGLANDCREPPIALPSHRPSGVSMPRPRAPIHSGGGRLIAAAVVVVAVAAVLAGCAQQRAAAPPPAPQPASPPGAPAAFGGTDAAWIELTIAMDEQVKPLLDLVPRHSSDRVLPALAGPVRDLVNIELPTLRLLPDEAGLPAQNPHAGMVMPGLVTADQVARAAALHGTEFDAYTAPIVEEYLAHGVELARSELRNGREPRTRALAATVLDGRTQILAARPST